MLIENKKKQIAHTPKNGSVIFSTTIYSAYQLYWKKEDKIKTKQFKAFSWI